MFNMWVSCKGRIVSKIYMKRVMELESGSERFRAPKTASQEKVLVNDSVPASTNRL